MKRCILYFMGLLLALFLALLAETTMRPDGSDAGQIVARQDPGLKGASDTIRVNGEMLTDGSPKKPKR